MPNSPKDLHTTYETRRNHYAAVHAQMDEVLAMRDGAFPAQYQGLFPPEMPQFHVEMIRLAWDDLAATAGKVFPVHAPPRNSSAKARNDAEKVEKVALSWNDIARRRGGLDMDSIMDILAWWVVGCADGVLCAFPDYELKTPFFDVKDPRTHYPPPGWSPWSRAALDNTMFAYKLNLEELMLRYPDRADELRHKYNRTVDVISQRSKPDSKVEVLVAEWYSKDAWYVATLEDKPVVLLASEQGDKGHPGIVPVAPATLYSATQPKGRSVFAGQVGIEAALSRMFSQKLDYYDKTLYPLIFTTPLTHPDVRYGPGGVNILDPNQGQSKVQVVAPSNSVDADQMMSFAMGLSRMLNRNPEFQQGIGEADSAKALVELKSAINSFVQDQIWPPMIRSVERSYSIATHMDIELWGNVRKRASGKKRNSAYSVEYVPNIHLAPFKDDIRIEQGYGLGGYQGKLEIMQLLGAGLISRKTAMEEIPEYSEPEEELRRIQADKLEEIQFADLTNMAAQGQLQPGAIPEIQRLVEEDDMSMFDAIRKLDKAGQLRVQAPQEQAQGAIGGAPPDIAALTGSLEAGATNPELPSLRRLRGAAA